MRTRFFTAASLILLAAVTLAPLASRAQEGTVPVTTVITVLGPKFTAPPQYSKDDIAVTEGKEKFWLRT